MKSMLAYTGIRVTDLERPLEFYTQVLGMVEKGRERLEAAQGIVVDRVSEGGASPQELNYYETGSPFATECEAGEGLDPLGFKVDDLDEAMREAGRAGYSVVQEMGTAKSRWVYLQDPNGIWIELSA